MRVFFELGASEYAGPNPSADEICRWDAPASELGLEPPAPAGGGAPDAGATADAAADSDHAADASAASDQGEDAGDDAAHAEAADAGDDDPNADPLDALSSDDEPDDPKTQRTIEDRYKGLKQRARKLERAYKKHLGTIAALRESGTDLRTLLARSQKLAEFERSLETNPRLRALVMGDPDDDGASDRGRRGRAEANEEPVTYPFDTNDEVGRFLSDFHKSSTSSTRDIASRLERIEKQLGGRLDRIEQGTRQSQVTAIQAQWKSATAAATEKLPKEYRSMFNDAVYGAMQQVLRGELRATPQLIIDHYLKQVRVSTQTKKVASDAAKQRIAANNDKLPRRPNGSAGSPASPRSRAVPRLEQFNRDISRRFGAV